MKPGTFVVIGPGQSAECKDGKNYAKSAENQVYVQNDLGPLNTLEDLKVKELKVRDIENFGNFKLSVENCIDGAEWPSASK